MVKTDFPERLLAWRLFKGLTLQQVSDRSRVNLTLLNKVECGHRDLGTWALYAVVRKALKITMTEFWGLMPKGTPKPLSRAQRGGRPRTQRSQMLARAA